MHRLRVVPELGARRVSPGAPLAPGLERPGEPVCLASVIHGAGLLLVLVPVPQHGPWPMAPGVPDGAGLLLLMPFTRHCPSWCPA